MCNKITIKAELLKWCPVGFSFHREEHPNTEFAMKQVSYGQVFADCWPDYLGSMSSDIDVEVNAKDYERVCIDSINEMVRCDFDTVFKHKHGVFVATKAGFNVPVHCDPRPTTEEYEINL